MVKHSLVKKISLGIASLVLICPLALGGLNTANADATKTNQSRQYTKYANNKETNVLTTENKPTQNNNADMQLGAKRNNRKIHGRKYKASNKAHHHLKKNAKRNRNRKHVSSKVRNKKRANKKIRKNTRRNRHRYIRSHAKKHIRRNTRRAKRHVKRNKKRSINRKFRRRSNKKRNHRYTKKHIKRNVKRSKAHKKYNRKNRMKKHYVHHTHKHSATVDSSSVNHSANVAPVTSINNNNTSDSASSKSTMVTPANKNNNASSVNDTNSDYITNGVVSIKKGSNGYNNWFAHPEISDPIANEFHINKYDAAYFDDHGFWNTDSASPFPRKNVLVKVDGNPTEEPWETHAELVHYHNPFANWTQAQFDANAQKVIDMYTSFDSITNTNVPVIVGVDPYTSVLEYYVTADPNAQQAIDVNQKSNRD